MIGGHALSALGLSPGEEDTYRALLEVPDTDVTTLARVLGVAESEVSKSLAALSRAGLAKMVADDRFAAAAPDSSLISLLSDRMDALRRGYDAVGELERVYRDAKARHGTVPGSETVTGAVAVRSRIGQLQDRAREEVCKFVRPPLLTDNTDSCDAAVARGVRFRMLYEKAMLDNPAAMEVVRQAAQKGKQVRFAATLPVKLLIVDGRTVFISEGGDHPVGLVTEHPALVTLALGLFEQIWPTAVPASIDLAPGQLIEPGLSDPDDRLLLSLLLAGLTDQAIAVRLGVGLRTVQRRVRDLMDAAGVDTRIQLGWQASRKGWVA